MSPGGHLVTTTAVCAAAAATTESWPLVAGLAAGGFLIDVDHFVDYVGIERQRDIRPGAFLRYYMEGRARRTVLALHSYELFAVLIALAWSTGNPWLLGYVGGSLLHLALDLAFNGEYVPHSIVLFYSFVYRALHRFDAARLLGAGPPRPLAPGFWRAFFGTPETREGSPEAMIGGEPSNPSPPMLDSAGSHASARRRG